MSNMKNLLGDIDFEEVEVMRTSRDNTNLTDSDRDNVVDLWKKNGMVLYKNWMDAYGLELAAKWVLEHDEPVNDEWITAYGNYMADQFMEWFDGTGR